MTTEDDFHKLLDANPEDHHTRLVLADFLQEQGDPRAEGYRALGTLGLSPLYDANSKTFAWTRHDNKTPVNTVSGSNTEETYPTGTRHGLPGHWRSGKSISYNHRWADHKSRREADDGAALGFADLSPEEKSEILGQSEKLRRRGTRRPFSRRLGRPY